MKRKKRGSQERAKPSRVGRTIASVEPVGCGDDVIKGREVPPHPDGQRLLRQDLEVMREWLTREWLCTSGGHPVRDVWRRSDGSATLELQSLGASIARIVPKARVVEGGKRLLREWRNRIIGSDLVNMRGALFEIYAAGLFDGDAHPVRTVSEGEPGYDFAVTFGNGGTLRVSCKSRDDSTEERTAAKFSAALRDRIKSTIPPGFAVGVEIFAPQKAAASLFSVDHVFPRVRQAIGSARRRGEATSSVDGDWRVRAHIVESGQEGLTFRDLDRLSFTLLVGVPLDRDLIVERFRQRVIGAISNVQAHCDVGDDRANVIVFRIPTKLGIAESRAAILDAFNATTSTATSSVFMYRAQLLTVDPKRETYYLGHELYEVQNERAPRAGRIMPRGTIALKLHGGQAQKVEPVWMVTNGDQQFAFDVDMWMRSHGEHYYVHPELRGDIPIRRIHGVAQWLTYVHPVSGGIVERQLSADVQDAFILL